MRFEDDCRRIAQWLREGGPAVAFTGAGISTESGIPDFRSPGGIWAQSQPVYFQDFLDSADARREYWRQKCVSHRDFAAAKPNDGHRVLAGWEEKGLLEGVITQNIDGLHQDAGSRRVLELHGTARRIGCLACKRHFDPQPLVERFLATGEVPDCPDCGGLLKHATVSFGQALPPEVLEEAVRWAQRGGLLLAMGSSLVVEPAASIPRIARQSGARVAIINRDPTGQDATADAVIHDGIGRALTAIDAMAG